MWDFYKILEFCMPQPQGSPECVQRDELSYQTNRNPLFFLGTKSKYDDHLQQPLLDQIKGDGADETKGVDRGHHHHHHGSDGTRVNMRIKVKMTKEEARRLLAKCRDQKGTLAFRDVALELVNIPPHRIIEVSDIGNSTTCHGLMLPTLQE